MPVKEWSRAETTSRPKPAASRTSAEPNLSTILAFFGAFILIWTLYFAITEAPVAIKHDMAEAYAWGQEFQLGYNQHPPFWAWICGLWFTLFPRTGWAFALLSSVNAAIGLWGAWMLIGDFAEGRKRIAAWAPLLLTPLYTFYAYKYNANTIFLSIWPWTLHYFMKSVRDRGTGDGIVFGILIGLAMMSKYYAVILVATCLLAALLHPSRRRYFASASPYISAVIALAVFVPHAAWLLTHKAPPLHYLANVSGQEWDHVVVHAAKTLLDCVVMLLGVVLVVGVAALQRGRATASGPATGGPTLHVVATLALAPLVLTIASSLALRTNITSEMTIGTFALLPLLMIEVANIRDIDRLYWIGTRLAGVVTLGALAISPAIALSRTYLSSKAMSVLPYQEVAIEATRIWRDRTSRPLVFVAGSDWYENAIAFYGPERPHVFVHFNYSRNLWVTPADLSKHGLLSVCVSDDRVCLAETAGFVTPETTRTELSLAHVFLGHVARPVHFVIMVIPPQG